MIIDSNLQFANAVLVAYAPGTYLLGNVVDTGLAGEIETGDELYFVVGVSTAIVAASAGTLRFSLVADVTSAVSTTTSQIIYGMPAETTGATAIPAGSLLFSGALPKDIGTYMA